MVVLGEASSGQENGSQLPGHLCRVYINNLIDPCFGAKTWSFPIKTGVKWVLGIYTSFLPVSFVRPASQSQAAKQLVFCLLVFCPTGIVVADSKRNAYLGLHDISARCLLKQQC